MSLPRLLRGHSAGGDGIERDTIAARKTRQDLEFVTEAMAGTHIAERDLTLGVDHVNSGHFAALDDGRHRHEDSVRLADDESDFDIHAGRQVERAWRKLEARSKGARRGRGLWKYSDLGRRDAGIANVHGRLL